MIMGIVPGTVTFLGKLVDYVLVISISESRDLIWMSLEWNNTGSVIIGIYNTYYVVSNYQLAHITHLSIKGYIKGM